ncbi:hypothetical protein BBJ29_000008 [Phytophthora kernoviae]|uniref:RxLR effector protein n=1 Tax=Phytophthora kernoviae TaxID=325452 RepID=A0A3F2S3G1_9STRA|nr:hypothetical protein BBJ29_000008 [Phytophthora kernoviae]RLN68999.1 hypothetical protein BBP00_00000627 [Phytophthora kernoviae]
MRRGVLTLLLVALALLATVGFADESVEEVAVDVDSDLLVEEEETLQTEPVAEEPDAVPAHEVDPRLTPEVIEKIFSKLTAKCLKQVQENPTDPSQMSERCRAEVARRVQRYLARLDTEEKGETQEKSSDKPAKKKRRSRKSKKQTRAHREAAAALKKEEEYQQTLQTIIGFVLTLVAIIGGAIFFINRKLKAAGMYFPDPDAKATCSRCLSVYEIIS